MVESTITTITGHAGELAHYEWRDADSTPGWIAVLVHGYGEHLGRYEATANTLVDAGAVVLGADHVGHGRSAGERVLVEDFEKVVEDVRLVVRDAQGRYPELPTVLIGHSLGGMIAARYAQRFPEDLRALVLSAPVLGTWHVLDQLECDEIPDVPIDPSTLSRDPEVGARYAADPLVWHGPFKRTTLEALDDCLREINFDHPLGDELHALWLHGGDDELVPINDTRTGMDRIRGLNFEEFFYPGARHEVFNETNSDEVLTDLTAFVARTIG